MHCEFHDYVKIAFHKMRTLSAMKSEFSNNNRTQNTISFSESLHNKDIICLFSPQSC